MNTLILTDKQLQVVNDALNFYARIGIGQFEEIKEHPTFQKLTDEICRPKHVPKIGDRTPQGEILEIKGNKALINGSVDRNGFWTNKKKWINIKDVELSTDYGIYHHIRELADDNLNIARGLLTGDNMHKNASYSINNSKVDETCRIAFDIHQVIRHEKWKRNPKRSEMTVDSSVSQLSSEPMATCEIIDE